MELMSGEVRPEGFAFMSERGYSSDPVILRVDSLGESLRPFFCPAPPAMDSTARRHTVDARLSDPDLPASKTVRQQTPIHYRLSMPAIVSEIEMA